MQHCGLMQDTVLLLCGSRWPEVSFKATPVALRCVVLLCDVPAGACRMLRAVCC